MNNASGIRFSRGGNKEDLERRLELLRLSGINEIFVEKLEAVNKPVLRHSTIKSGVFGTKGECDILRTLALKYKNCQKCHLAKTRHNFVYGEGKPDADIMLIGEGPGEQEDLKGRPFVGAAGQLLDKMLKAISLRREEIYITNVVKCRPPKNRNPLADEIASCMPYLYEQISIVKPKIICALGKVAGNCLLDNTESLGNMRGKFYRFQDALLMVTYHPSALLYHAEWKRPAWEDLKMLMREYKKIKHLLNN